MKKEDVDKLPRKLKKKRYGTRNNRKHLALVIMDNPKIINKLLALFTPSVLPLSLLKENG